MKIAFIAKTPAELAQRVNRIRRTKTDYTIKAEINETTVRIYGNGSTLKKIRVNDKNHKFTQPRTTSEFIRTIKDIGERL